MFGFLEEVRTLRLHQRECDGKKFRNPALKEEKPWNCFLSPTKIMNTLSFSLAKVTKEEELPLNS